MVTRFVVLFISMLVFWIPHQSGVAQEGEDILPTLTGRIAYVGDDFNIYNFHLADNEIFSLTKDARVSRRYQWPTWSLDGRLAYFCCDAQFAPVRAIEAQVYISDDAVQTGTLTYDERNQQAIYAYWSPETCETGNKCENLAVLINNLETRDLQVELFQSNGGSGESINQMLASGNPFYYSWSPNGTRMIWHRNNRTLDIYDVTSGEIVDTLSNTPGSFQAPAWSPVDDRVLFAVRDDAEDAIDLVIQANDISQVLVEDLTGNVSFSWSPDGNYVAYRVTTSDNFDALYVVDAISGEIVTRSGVNGVLAFFWSPDSNQIAYITLATPPGTFNIENSRMGLLAAPNIYQENRTSFAWSVLNLSMGTDQRYSAFVPTYEMIYLLTYFDQFNQSHRIWSPDSTHIVYSEITNLEEPQPVISVLDVSQADTVPFSIANGVFAVWSFE